MRDAANEARQMRLASRACALLASVILVGLPGSYAALGRFIDAGAAGEVGAVMGWLIFGVPLGAMLALIAFVLARAAGQREG